MKAEISENKIAIVFGASGLIGNYLVHHLCESPHYREVLTFSRHIIGFKHAKIKEVINDLKDLSILKNDLLGHDVFCCLGTTIKKAGNQENFRKIDFDLPIRLARLSEENKIRGFFVVSSIGANVKSTNFYLRTKGEMEKEVMDCGIPRIAVVRPSMLLGKRNEFRFGEEVGKILMKVVSVFLLGKYRKYKAIHAETVAKAMIKIANDDYSDQDIYESDELEEIAKSTGEK
jgi:uncharacterized protein YbjT (DUF2867 family)